MQTPVKTMTALVTVLAFALTAGITAAQNTPKMKLTTPIPADITMPDTVDTRVGALNFKNGIPDQAAQDKIWDYLDFSRAVQVYLNAYPAVSIYAAHKGPQDAGVPYNTMLRLYSPLQPWWPGEIAGVN